MVVVRQRLFSVVRLSLPFASFSDSCAAAAAAAAEMLFQGGGGSYLHRARHAGGRGENRCLFTAADGGGEDTRTRPDAVGYFVILGAWMLAWPATCHIGLQSSWGL